MTDSIRPLILTASPAFQPFAAVPPTRTRAELGLPDDWTPRWEEEQIQGFDRLLAKFAEEVWARTEEATHNAATAAAEIVVRRLVDDHAAYLALESVWIVEQFAMAAQAALVGFALGQTLHDAHDLELWTQQAMQLVALRMETPEARRAARDAWHTAYEEDARQRGEARPPRRADWADGPTTTPAPDTTVEVRPEDA